MPIGCPLGVLGLPAKLRWEITGCETGCDIEVIRVLHWVSLGVILITK